MVFPIRESMKDTGRFRQLYANMMVFVFVICCVFGFMSYLVSDYLIVKAIGDTVTSVIFYYFGQQYEFLFFLEILYGTVVLHYQGYFHQLSSHPYSGVRNHSKKREILQVFPD